MNKLISVTVNVNGFQEGDSWFCNRFGCLILKMILLRLCKCIDNTVLYKKPLSRSARLLTNAIC